MRFFKKTVAFSVRKYLISHFTILLASTPLVFWHLICENGGVRDTMYPK